MFKKLLHTTIVTFLIFTCTQLHSAQYKHPQYAQMTLSRVQHNGPEYLDVLFQKKNGEWTHGLKAIQEQTREINGAVIQNTKLKNKNSHNNT